VPSQRKLVLTGKRWRFEVQRRNFGLLSLAGLAAALTLSTAPVMAQEGPQIWTYWASGAEANALTALMDVANEEFPEAPLTPRVITGNTAEMRAALQTAFLGGNPPAIYQSGMGQELKSFVDSGRLEPIDDVWADVDGATNFPEGVKRVITFDDKVYGVPLNLHIVSNVFYNKKIFAELGLEVPTTVEEFQAVGQALRDGGYQALGNAGGPAWTLYETYPFLYAALGRDDYYALGSGEIPFTDPRIKQAIQTYTDTYVVNYMADWTGYSWADAGAQFAEGKVGMYEMGDWLSAYLADAGMTAGEDFDYFPAPGMDGAVVIQMDLMALTAQDDEAVVTAGKNFLRAAAGPAGQEAFNLLKGSVAANLTAPSDQYGYYSKAAFAQVAAAGDAVVPNLKNLLPVQLGDEFGNQIVAYAQNPSPEALDTMLAVLEEGRAAAEGEGLFYKW